MLMNSLYVDLVRYQIVSLWNDYPEIISKRLQRHYVLHQITFPWFVFVMRVCTDHVIEGIWYLCAKLTPESECHVDFQSFNTVCACLTRLCIQWNISEFKNVKICRGRDWLPPNLIWCRSYSTEHTVHEQELLYLWFPWDWTSMPWKSPQMKWSVSNFTYVQQFNSAITQMTELAFFKRRPGFCDPKHSLELMPLIWSFAGMHVTVYIHVITVF